MKRYYMALICNFFACASLFGQNSDDISTWVALHPNVYLLSSETYNSISQEMRDKLGTNVLIYDGQLTIEAIEQFNQTESKSLNTESSYREDEAQEIKNWLGQHPDLKIVPRSYYEGLTDAQKQEYVLAGSLILIGETITLEDIRNY